jgi:hypothetical protein
MRFTMARHESGWISCPVMNEVALPAYGRRRDGVGSFSAAVGGLEPEAPTEPAGERWDIDDDGECRRHLPRLTALRLDR